MIVVRVSSDPLAVRNSADGIGRNVANQLFHGFCRRGIVSENSLRTGKKLGLAEPTLELLLSAEAALANMRLEQEGPQLLVSRVGTYMEWPLQQPKTNVWGAADCALIRLEISENSSPEPPTIARSLLMSSVSMRTVT